MKSTLAVISRQLSSSPATVSRPLPQCDRGWGWVNDQCIQCANPDCNRYVDQTCKCELCKPGLWPSDAGGCVQCADPYCCKEGAEDATHCLPVRSAALPPAVVVLLDLGV